MAAASLATGHAAAEQSRSHLEPAGGTTTGPPSFTSLGLTLSRASAVLRQQLALTRGAGLVVEQVAAGSAAARAGFLQHDVLVRLDDQLLLLPEQLDALLESAEKDTPLDCTVLRAGREVVLPLAKGTVNAARPSARAATSGGLRPTASSLALVQQAATKSGPVEAAPLRRLADETLVRQDTDYQIRLTAGDETRLVVSDPRGRVVFNAAIDTPEDRSRMPSSVRDRVVQMERMLEGRQQPVAAAGQPATASQSPLPAAKAEKTEIGRLDVAPVELR
ncbi:MAG: hypothetical protein ACR2IT_09215 [Pirellulales bacterium]